MIEIKQFDGKSITPKDDALVYDLLFNGYGIFNGCSVSFLGANQLLVSSGRLIVRGRQVVITEETVAAQLSSDGTKKGRLYIHIDLSSASNPIEFRTVVADDLPALTQEDDVNYNDGIFEVELCRYDVSETAISNIVETCPSITGGADLLRTIEEVMANTTPGNAVDALVIKELNESLQYPKNTNVRVIGSYNGKNIYRKYIDCGNISHTASQETVLFIDSSLTSGEYGVFDYKVFVDGQRNINCYWGADSYNSFELMCTNNGLQLKHNSPWNTNARVEVFVDYYN